MGVKPTIAPPEMDEQMAFEVGLLVQQHDLLAKQSVWLKLKVAELLDSEPALRLQTIPGVGAATAASLIAEIGDIWRLDDFDQLAAYAGPPSQGAELWPQWGEGGDQLASGQDRQLLPTFSPLSNGRRRSSKSTTNASACWDGRR